MMNRLPLLFVAIIVLAGLQVEAQNPKFRHVMSAAELKARAVDTIKGTIPIQAVAAENVDSVRKPRSLDEILRSLPYDDSFRVSIVRAPWVYRAYHNVEPFVLKVPEFVYSATVSGDNIVEEEPDWQYYDAEDEEEPHLNPDKEADLTVFTELPLWLKNAIASRKAQEDLVFSTMMLYPNTIEYSYWQLPEPIRLKEDDNSAQAIISKQKISEPDIEDAEIWVKELGRINWLHKFGGSVQLSQAFLSPNWYQGGVNHLALLLGLSWNVQLNKVYHPKLLFDNTISYKLGLNSTPQDLYHSYSISQDILQWNLRTGYQAHKKWFYSFTAQFKTQLFNTYPKDSQTRKASLLSPGDLTLGLGMTYATTNNKKTFNLEASISPLSYNLKTCLDELVDPTQYGMTAGTKMQSEIGSSADITVNWNMTSNINYKSRMFLFTNYSTFLGDWENTFSFAINKFLTTQLYLHLRYDSSAGNHAEGWNHWMFKEILSFGFAYTFSTK